MRLNLASNCLQNPNSGKAVTDYAVMMASIEVVKIRFDGFADNKTTLSVLTAFTFALLRSGKC